MTATSTIRFYDSWSQVPTNTYLTKTQLASLDLPRRPGPVRARVEGYDFRNKKTIIDLYRIDESTPSPATARALTAARGRATGPDAYLCTDCGARPSLPVTVYQDGARLCRTCAHIRHLRTVQADAATRRAHIARTAADLLAGPLAVIHCDLVTRGTTPSGTPRKPSAVRVAAVDADGRQLIRTTVRLVGPRSKGIPDDAVAVDDIAPALKDALAGRRIAHWHWTGFGDLTAALYSAGHKDVIPGGHGDRHDLSQTAVWWRADLDPRTGHFRMPIPPDRADRLLYLLQQIAAGAPNPADTPAD